MTAPIDRPNIVLIHGHDLGDWLSCYGRTDVQSPNLQSFADTATVFDAAFAVSPLCTPARSAIFTGQMPHKNGLMGLSHDGWQYQPGVRTLPELLGADGYRTALLGLQHENLDPRLLGYEEVHGQGFLPRALEVAKLAEKWFGALVTNESDDSSTSAPGAADDRRPYFAAVGMWEVHRPWPTADYAPVDPEAVEVPPYLPDNAHTREDVSQFLGAIKQMDDAVGRILDAIDSSPQAANTVVIFTTDHGVAFPRAKSTLYDSGVKVAFMVRPPAAWNIPPTRTNSLVSHLDVVPTLLELAGIALPDSLDGESQAQTLRGVAAPVEDVDRADGGRALVLEKTYHDRYDPMRAIRTRSAKFIRNFVEAPLLPLALDLEESATRKGMGDAHLQPRPSHELYLLESDPWELKNVVDDPMYASLRDELAAELHARMLASDDPILTGPIGAPSAPSRELPAR